MSKTKQTTKTTEPRELAKTLTVDGQSYNINAKKAEELEKSITFTSKKYNGQEANIEYNGAEEVTIPIVPATGGIFDGPVKVPDTNLATAPSGTILNYGDISKLLPELTGSGWYTWKNNIFTAVTKENVNQHLGVVIGSEETLNTPNTGFAAKNYAAKYLPMYLYICLDTGNIYYGESAINTTTRLATNSTVLKVDGLAGTESVTGAELLRLISTNKINFDNLIAALANGSNKVKNAQNADNATNATNAASAGQATKLASGRNLKVNLASTSAATFDGTNAASIGVEGILPIAYGGTGANNASGACTSIISNQTISPKIIDVGGEQYYAPEAGVATGKYGIHMHNSDIIGLNGIFFLDSTNHCGEGIYFRSDGNTGSFDKIYSHKGVLYYVPTLTVREHDADKSESGTSYALYHAGNLNTDRIRKITISTSDPSGGSDGDIWIKYS